MASERFHRAAKDSILAVLKEATRRDCNARDEDGMTPTMWAAFEGHIDALRLLVARGGDPDKGDHFNNTSLHFAAERGHMSCVSFLVNFGANLWSLNFDMHTPKELAAMKGRDDVLRFLDEASAKEETTNRKEVKAKKDKAQKEMEKKLKDYEKVKKKADKYAEEEQLRLQKARQKMGQNFVEGNGVQPHRPSTIITALRNKTIGPSTKVSTGASPRFSEIVGTVSARKFGTSAVQKKLQQKLGAAPAAPNDFKVIEDGRRSVSTLTGLRRDSEVLYAGQYGGEGRRGRLLGVFADAQDSGKEEEVLDEAEDVLLQEPASIFDRPGFGSFAFRKSISSTLSALPIPAEVNEDGELDEGSIGSAGSLAKRTPHHDLSDSDDADSMGDDWSPLQLFLAAHGLAEYIERFVKEKIDLESILLLTDDDLSSLGLPLGPRRKLTIAIENRRKILAEPGQVQDSQL